MKPLGRKNYGSIGHLPMSRMGPADHAVHEGQAVICTKRARDRRDIIRVTEKLDGSNVGIARIDGAIVALGRAGYLARSSRHEQHHMFADWVDERQSFWLDALDDGQRLVGEWLAQAHGTLYTLPFGPFVAFDLMVEDQRLPFVELDRLCSAWEIPMPRLVHRGGPLEVEIAMDILELGDHGADEPEGVVYRVERDGAFDFMAKYVRPDKVDGKFLPDVPGAVVSRPIWNWRPMEMAL